MSATGTEILAAGAGVLRGCDAVWIKNEVTVGVICGNFFDFLRWVAIEISCTCAAISCRPSIEVKLLLSSAILSLSCGLS